MEAKHQKIHHRIHHHAKRHLSVHKKMYRNILASLTLTVFALFLLFVITRGAVPHASELAFIEHSIFGVSAGSVVPASCNSDPHFAGDCAPTMTASLSVTPTSVSYGGVYNPLKLTSTGASFCDMYSMVEGASVWTFQGTVSTNASWGPSAPLYKTISFVVNCFDGLGGVKQTNVVTITVAPNIDFQTTPEGAGFPWAKISSFTYAPLITVPDYGSVTLSWSALGSCVGSSDASFPTWNTTRVPTGFLTLNNPTTYSSTKSGTYHTFTLTCTKSATSATRSLQIYFSNDYDPPVTCFTADTKVTLADGTTKDIKDIKVGDKVRGESGSVNSVVRIETPPLGDRLLYSINGGKAFVTAEHPFMTTKGWKSVDPTATKKENAKLNVGTLAVGDILLTENGEVVITSLVSVQGNPEEILYNLILDGGHTYYANGFLVHNKMPV